MPELTMYRCQDSVAMTICPVCLVQNFADQEALQAIQANKAFPVCPVCGVLCETGTIPEGTPEPLTIEDLDRVILAGTQVTAKEATHEEFDDWARGFMAIIETEDIQWRPQQRADFCDLLLMQGKIEVLPRMIEEAPCSKDH